MKAEISEKIAHLPHSPGVYQYFNQTNEIIYVGKAKNLQKRVKSYFNKNQNSPKTSILVSKICDIQYVLVDTEQSALLLENSLIKKYQPKYNIQLKDDKTYPWICVTKERFPKVLMTRKVNLEKGYYYGPYPHTKTAKNLLELIKELYPIRTCNFDLSETKISSGKYQVCLDFHIKKCLAPCVGKQTQEDYDANIQAIKHLLKGNTNRAISHFEEKMRAYARTQEFEMAQDYKIKLDSLKNHQSKSMVVNPTIDQVEVFTMKMDTDYVFYNYLRINNGSIIQAYTNETRFSIEESKNELLATLLQEVRQRFQSETKEVILEETSDFLPKELTQTIPQIGDKKRLLEMSQRNVWFYRTDFRKQQKVKDPKKYIDRIMEVMKLDLNLSEEPRHIECFDNSNIQGKNPASACVVFKNGRPSKKDYRHFTIKTVEGPDDYASMKEVVFRRYNRLVEENQSLPQLIVIDGGKGQLNAALQALEEIGLKEKITVIGIAKRLDEIYFEKDEIPLYLDKTSETLKVIQQARNEAHRFSLRHHRNLRSKGQFSSILEEIEGVGEQTTKKLLTHFGSVQRIKDADWKQVAELVGKQKATIIQQYLSARER